MAAGLVGSDHCLLMCGSIAGALGLSSRAAAQRQGTRWTYPLAYNGGRVVSYTVAGALVGGFGQALTTLDDVGVLRLALQLAAASMLLAFGLALVAGGSGRFVVVEQLGLGLWRQLSPALKHVLPIRSPGGAFVAGTIWGWLPCAMAYGALLVAWMSASVVGGAALMLAFGLGTLPALVLGSGATMRLGQMLARPSTRLMVGLLIAALGLVTLVSPWLDGAHGEHGAAGGVLDYLRSCLPSLHH